MAEKNKAEKKAVFVSPFASMFPEDIPDIEGLSLHSFHAKLRYKREDMFLIKFEEPVEVAGIFTKSAIVGEAVKWCRQRLALGNKASALVVNSGVSNVFTGAEGKKIVEETARAASEVCGCKSEEVYISSTGVIGQLPDLEKITGAIRAEFTKSLTQKSSWHRVASAMMTTDSFPKSVVRKAKIGEQEVNLIGIIKGSGMVAPDMATMLGYIFTDAKIPSSILQQLLDEVKEVSYNAITVDSDTSTSDTVLAFATGKKKHASIEAAGGDLLADFRQKFFELNLELAKLVVKDGEGISKFITVNIEGAASNVSAKKIAMAIANSPLVKTAIAGEDANWGRIVMAIGKAQEPINPDKISIKIGDVLVAKNGKLNPNYSEETLQPYMEGQYIEISVNVGLADDIKSGGSSSGSSGGSFTCYSSDLTHEYIKINADYRS